MYKRNPWFTTVVLTILLMLTTVLGWKILEAQVITINVRDIFEIILDS
ncbi:MAG: hypothetical protein QNJ55_25685 [Xenococcus sp. MO_188.B8]|nr:hypothetical protein [Xenococcus sp. MO_188.B8]